MPGRKRKRGVRGKPWYKADKDKWYITLAGVKTPLSDAKGRPVRGKDNRAAAERVCHEMHVLAAAPDRGADNPVRVVLEKFLADAARRVSAKTLGNYVRFFRSFDGRWPELSVRELRPAHVHAWWDERHPDWGASQRALAASALKAAFNWAAAPGKGGRLIPDNPLHGMPHPTTQKRSSDSVVTEAEFRRLLALVPSEPVRDMLEVLWETGTRPANLSRASRANLTPDGNALLFTGRNTDPSSAVHKTFKKTGRPLLVPLTPRAGEICRRLAADRHTGPLFLSPTGKPWTDVRFATLVGHYAAKAGLKGRFTAYSCRHAKATALLERGVPDALVAAALGNTPAVIHRNYSHVGANAALLCDVVSGAWSAGGTGTRPPAGPTA